jgi:hypothetical protein
MIYIIDEEMSEDSHSNRLKKIILEHAPDANITIIPVELEILVSSITDTLDNLSRVVQHTDIVLCAWCVYKNHAINNAFSNLSQLCWVVVAAGNSGKEIKHFSPASAPGVMVIGALNKSGGRASLSNYCDSSIDMNYVTGTNYHIDNFTMNGTSVSAALFAAFLSEAIRLKDGALLHQKIEELKIDAKAELSINNSN